MKTAKILSFRTTLPGVIGTDYTGIIVSHKADGTGTIMLRSPPELRGHILNYTSSNIQVAAVRGLCRPGMGVEGRARHNFPLPGWNISTLEPLGGLGNILAPAPPPQLWQRFRKLIWFWK